MKNFQIQKLIITSFYLLISYQIYANTDCHKLDEKQCVNSKHCTPERGPSLCGSGFCTDDLVFKKCTKFTKKGLLWLKKAKKVKAKERQLCSSTKGTWKKSELEKFGRCQCKKDYRFITNKGCTSFAIECKKAGGTFYPARKLKCNDYMRLHYPKYCQKKYVFRSKYNSRDLCLCDNKKLWSLSAPDKPCTQADSGSFN